MTDTNKNIILTQVHTILAWKDADGSWQTRSQTGTANTAELDAPNLPAVTPAGEVSRNSLPGSQLDLDAVVAATATLATCKVPDTNEIVYQGGIRCIDGTMQACSSNGEWRDTGNQC